MKRALMLVLLLGCRTQPIVRPDLGGEPPPDLATTVDLARASDFGTTIDLALPNMCVNFTRRAVMLSSLALLDPPGRSGQAVRLLLALRLRDCDRAGDVQIEVQPGNATDFVSVTAYAWISSEGCGAPTVRQIAQTIPTFPDSGNPRLAIRDAAIGGTVRLDVSLLPQLGDCTTMVPTGGACTRDCQCPSTVRCIPTGSGNGVCALPCTNDFDCAASCRPDGDPRYTCYPGPAPTRPNDQPGQSCRCSADCPTGEVCGPFGCIHPCTTHAECPPAVDYCSNGECVRVL